MLDRSEERAAQFDQAGFGEAALYKAGGLGAGVAVTVIPKQPQESWRSGAGGISAAARSLLVRVSEVANLVRGDTFVIAGTTWRVEAPRRYGRDRALWHAELSTVS